MRIAIVAVGKRTEHWDAFFRALARQPGIALDLQTADISSLAKARLEMLAARHPNVRFRNAAHWIGEDRTGHMASIVFAPGSWRWLQDANPDVIHIIGEASYLATLQTIAFRNRFWPTVPITLYAAQNVIMRLPAPFPLIERYAYRHTTLALPITPAALNVLRAKGYRGEAEVTPLGVDLARFHPGRTPEPAPFTVGFVGRLEPHKGLRDLVAAAELARCRLVVVGTGSLRPWLEVEAARRPGAIELRPWATHDELPDIVRLLHALALPSVEIVQRNVLPWKAIPLREQFGRILLEAMACGVPVVGTTVGEIPYVIGGAGLTVPPGSPRALADALALIRDNSDLAARLSRAGVERASLFDWDKVAARVRTSWQRLARAHAASSVPGSMTMPVPPNPSVAPGGLIADRPTELLGSEP